MLQGGTSGNMEVNTYTFDSSQTVTVGTLVAGKVKTQNLEVGASAAPSGITLYDTKTGEPYCVVIENGAFKSIPGKCDNFVFIPSTSVPLPSEEPAPEPTTELTTTSTEETGTPTPPEADVGARSTESTATSTEPVVTEIATTTEPTAISTTTEPIVEPAPEAATTTEPIVEEIPTTTEPTVVEEPVATSTPSEAPPSA